MPHTGSTAIWDLRRGGFLPRITVFRFPAANADVATSKYGEPACRGEPDEGRDGDALLVPGPRGCDHVRRGTLGGAPGDGARRPRVRPPRERGGGDGGRGHRG